MTTPTVQSHRVLLSDGSTTLGLSLVKDEKTGRPALRRYFARPYADQQFTDLSENALNAEDTVAITENDWSGGFGVQDYTVGRYRQSFGVDASYPGILIPGPVGVASTQSTPSYATTTTITNGGFETNDLTGWTSVLGGGGTWATQSGTVWTETYAAQCVLTGVDGAAEIKNTLVSVDSSLFGDASTPIDITVVVYGRTSIAGAEVMTVTLKDSSGTTIATATANVSNAGWTAATLNHVFTESWPKLVVHVSFPVQSYTVYLDAVSVTINAGVIQTATNIGTLSGLVEYNGAHYAYGTTGLWKRTAANWARVAGSPDNIVHAYSDGTNLYLARGTSKNYWRMNSSEAFTRCTGTGNSAKPKFFLYAGGTMYGTDATTTCYIYSNLVTGATSSTPAIGQAGFNITGVLDHGAVPHFFGERWNDYINTSAVVIPNYTKKLSSLYNTNTGKNPISYSGAYYIPAGAQYLIENDSGTEASVGPNMNAVRLTDFKGQVVATAQDDVWLYVVVDNSTKIEILKGKASGSTFIWHSFFEDTYTTVAYAQVSSITAKRLWYGGGTALPKYIPLSTQYGDPLTDTALSFLTGTKYETGGYVASRRNANKTFTSVLFNTTGLNGTNTILVEYWKAGDSGWTTLGTLNTSPSQELFFASGITTKQLWLRFTWTLAASTTGTGIYYWTVNATTIEQRSQRISMRVAVGDSNTLESTGAVDDEMIYAVVASKLRSWASTHPLTLTLWDGTAAGEALTVKLISTAPEEQIIKEGSIDPPTAPESQFALDFVVQRMS